MTTYRMTTQQFQAYCRTRPQRILQELEQAEKASLADGLKIAQTQSSGPYSLAYLASVGHPYARRAPQPAFNPAIINIQSGEFLASWGTSGPHLLGAEMLSILFNASRVALFLDRGTRKMIERPFRAAIVKTLGPSRRKRIKAALLRALVP